MIFLSIILFCCLRICLNLFFVEYVNIIIIIIVQFYICGCNLHTLYIR